MFTSEENVVTHQHCPGYTTAAFETMVSGFPGVEVYPVEDFRVEWGPIFHRGRLDGSARVLLLGQDPATHEAIGRHILVGVPRDCSPESGIDNSYVMVLAKRTDDRETKRATVTVTVPDSGPWARTP